MQARCEKEAVRYLIAKKGFTRLNREDLKLKILLKENTNNRYA